MKALHEVNSFGAVDADHDTLLETTFEDHEAFQALWNMQRFLVIGRKGSGKTAIYKKILHSSSDSCFTIGHAFSDYPWHFHAEQARVGVPDFDKYTHSWKYLILLTISKILLNQDASIPFNDASEDSLTKLENFVVDTYGSRDLDVTQIFTTSKSLKVSPSFSVNTGLLKAGVSAESVPMDELPTIVQEVNANLLEHTLLSLNPDNSYYVCFDQLDISFDPTDSDYLSRIIGLLLACRDINVAAQDYGKRLVIAVFLRTDIYETLRFEDKNKLTENSVSTIEWDTPRTDKTLKELMEKRFTAVLADQDENEIVWNDVFDETSEMPGRQTKYQHLIDRTYLRPRDMIKFVNAVLTQHSKTVNQQPLTERFGNENTNKLINEDIHTARPEYSDYFSAEIDDEIHKHLPDYEKYLHLLRAVGAWQFDKESFARVVESRPDLSSGEHPGSILEKLYRYSLIGFYRAGGRGFGGSEYVFSYKEPRSKFDPTNTKFRVHPGLIEALGLKKISANEDR